MLCVYGAEIVVVRVTLPAFLRFFYTISVLLWYVCTETVLLLSLSKLTVLLWCV